VSTTKPPTNGVYVPNVGGHFFVCHDSGKANSKRSAMYQPYNNYELCIIPYELKRIIPA
jgi:hypothetical protein